MKISVRTRGFTVIELTIVLALISIAMGMVIVRLDWGSPRQRVIAASRKLGNAICTFRERAMSEQQLYALQLDLSENSWSIRRIDQTSSLAVQATPALYSGNCEMPVKVLLVKTANGIELPSPVIFAFDPRGTTAAVSIDMGIEKGFCVTLQLDPLVNEVNYAEH